MTIKEGTTLAAGWSRLQAASIELGIHLSKPYWTRYGWKVSVPDDVKENCEILGRGNEEEIKARIQWIAMYYPDVFNRSRRHMMSTVQPKGE